MEDIQEQAAGVQRFAECWESSSTWDSQVIDCALSPTLKKESRNLSMNWMKLFAPRYLPEVKERSLGEGSSSPARKFSEVQEVAEVLSNHVTQRRKTLSQHTQACLCDIRKLLIPRRKIEASQAGSFHIYVDASFDYSDYSGLGGLVVDMSKKILSFFSTEVDKRTLDEVMAKGQKTVIQELEMMAVLAAMSVGSFCSLTARQCEVPSSRAGQQTKTVTKWLTSFSK